MAKVVPSLKYEMIEPHIQGFIIRLTLFTATSILVKSNLALFLMFEKFLDFNSLAEHDFNQRYKEPESCHQKLSFLLQKYFYFNFMFLTFKCLIFQADYLEVGAEDVGGAFSLDHFLANDSDKRVKQNWTEIILACTFTVTVILIFIL